MLRTRKHRVDEVLARVPLTPPWTVAEFLGWMSDETGRVVELEPWSAWHDDLGGRCGLLLGSPERYVIKYDPTRTERHQRQDIFHECAHVLCKHEGEPFRPTESLLTEGIDLSSIEFMMRRSTFDNPTEAEAELIGTRLAVLSRGPIDLRSRGAVHRIAGTLGI